MTSRAPAHHPYRRDGGLDANNVAVVHEHAHGVGPEAGLALLDQLEGLPALRGYHLLDGDWSEIETGSLVAIRMPGRPGR
ncbi:MAG TPA: hypothetical protein VF086_08570 [Propionibacteriaceae bacterium]